MKSSKLSAKRIAPTLVGLSESAASKKALNAGCAIQFIVMDGRQCGRNTSVGNAVVCLFADNKGIIFDVVVGSRGVYEHPAYLAALPREEEPA
jgi:hypothetical protein